MSDRVVVRRLFLGSMIVAIVAVLVLSGVAFWPVWREYRLLPPLINAVKQDRPDLVNPALESIKKIQGGLLTAPALARLLKDSSPAVRRLALRTLGDLGPESERVLSELVDAMRDEVGAVRMQAASTLRRLGAPAIPPLIWALEQMDARSRSGAAEGLGTIGPNAERALPLLVPLAVDPDAGVRRWSVWAIGQIRPSDTTHLSLFVSALKDDDELVRDEAAWALAKLGPDVLPALLNAEEASDETDVQFRRGVAQVMFYMGRSAEAGLPWLAEAVNDPNAGLREAAARALREVEPRAATLPVNKRPGQPHFRPPEPIRRER